MEDCKRIMDDEKRLKLERAAEKVFVITFVSCLLVAFTGLGMMFYVVSLPAYLAGEQWGTFVLGLFLLCCGIGFAGASCQDEPTND